MNEKLKECINDDNEIKIVCTLRKQVAKSNHFANFDSILAINQFELADHFTDEEKHHILHNHIQNSEIATFLSSEEIDEICKNNFAFPLLCKLVTEDKTRFDNRLKLFTAPFEQFKEELDNLLNNCRDDYFILVLCMLLSGTIEVSEILSKDKKDFIRNVFDSCRVDTDINGSCSVYTNVSEIAIRNSLRRMEGAFLTQITENNYRFLHDKLLESVSCHFASKSPCFLFTVCPFDLIRDQVRINANLDVNDETNIILDKTCFKVVGERVLNELQQGRFSDVLFSQIIENIEFAEYLRSLILNKNINSFQLLKTKHHEVLEDHSERSLNFKNLHKFLNRVIKNDTNPHTINKDAIDYVMSNQSHSRLLDWIVAFGRDILFHCLWKNLNKSQIKTFTKRDSFFIFVKPLLSLAILGGNLEIIQTLIKARGDVLSYSENGNSVLVEAIKADSSRSYHIVSKLIERGFSVNEGDMFRQKTPLQECALAGNMEILNLLLDKNAEIVQTLVNGQTSFYKLYQNNTISLDIFKAIVRKDMGNTNIHVAVIDANRNDVECLMKTQSTAKNNNGQTALHLAALFEEFEIMKLLLEGNDDRNEQNNLNFCRSFMNTGDLNGVRPLHLAVMRSNYACVDLLLRHKASLFCQDNLGRTPCHFVQCAKIVNLLQPSFSIIGCVNDTKDDLTLRNIDAIECNSSISNDVVITIEENESKTETEKNCEGKFKVKIEHDKVDMLYILVTVFLNLILWCLPSNFTLLNRFACVFNRRDYDGNTPLHAIAKRISESDAKTIDTLRSTFNILSQKGGNFFLWNGKGLTPLDILPTKYIDKMTALKQRRLLFAVLYTTVPVNCLFFFLYVTMRLLVPHKEPFLPNIQQKCELASVEKYNNTMTVFYEFTIFQQSFWKRFVDVTFSIFLFCIYFLILHRRLHYIGSRFTVCFCITQVFKIVCFTILILSLVYTNSDYRVTLLQLFLIYMFFVDFETLLVLKNGNINCFHKQISLLTTTAYYIVLFTVCFCQINKIDFAANKWELKVNCSIAVPEEENNVTHYCVNQRNVDLDENFVIHLLADQGQNMSTVSQHNTSFFSTNSSLCSGTKTADEIAYYNIWYNVYESLAFLFSLCFIVKLLKIFILNRNIIVPDNTSCIPKDSRSFFIKCVAAVITLINFEHLFFFFCGLMSICTF